MMEQKIEIAGEAIKILAQKGLYWPKHKTLVVADLHFGKAATFRSYGIPVPHGTTSQSLQVLETLAETLDIESIVFLGDFFHARPAQARATLSVIQAWRAKWSHLKLTLIRGNHDYHAGDPPRELKIKLVNEPYHIAPFAFCHHPNVASDSYILAGHVHSAYRISQGLDSIRLPCFVIGKSRALLPAFGAFTGCQEIKPEVGEQLYVTTGEWISEVPYQKTKS